MKLRCGHENILFLMHGACCHHFYSVVVFNLWFLNKLPSKDYFQTSKKDASA
jgi:hypothetical protein